MNFLAHSEDRGPCASRAGHGGLEAQLPLELGLVESAHEILDLVEDTNVAGSEGSTEEAWGILVSPPVLMRAIPHAEGSLLVGGSARERHSE